MSNAITKECPRCGKILDVKNNFYSSKDIEKYPDGKMNLCKKCLTAHINHYDTTTFVPILKEMDIPYVERVWVETIVKKCEKKTAREISGMTVFGSYLSRMRLSQWKTFSFEDTPTINQKTLEELRDDYINTGMLKEDVLKHLAVYEKMQHSYIAKEGHEAEDIENVEDLKEMLKRHAVEKKAADEAAIRELEELAAQQDAGTPDNRQVEPDAAASSITITVDLTEDLTEDDIKYLLIKWGKEYTAHEWVQLEQLWNEHMNSFDIQTAAHKDYLKLICKASLRANQFINVGDIDGFNKVTKVYDQLMKSAKFTAVQNKEEIGEYVNCLSELVMIAEQDGPIPRAYVVDPRDKVDECLEDMKLFTSRLVKEETNLGELIEETLETLKDQGEEDTFFSGSEDEDENGDAIEETVLKDIDYEDFYDDIDKQKERDDA